eukprot:333512-Pyramimonas_sp.AAC.1
MADHDAHSCFWSRGIIPARWTQVSPPTSIERWSGSNLEAGPALLGHGTAASPLYVFGDASGGPDTHDVRLRRIGLAVCVIPSFTPFQ